jgi:hypothetical protein
MENTEKAKIIKYHYQTLGQNAPFMLRATGKFEWFDGHSEPSEGEFSEWVTAYESQKGIPEQRAECIRLLNESEMHVSNDPPYPDDSATWKAVRKDWRTILKSDVLQEIPPKPF